MGHKLTLASYRTLCRSASWWLCINDWISPTISCGFKMQGKAAGIEREVAQALVDASDKTCPYSKATRGNIDVVISLI